MLLLCAATSLCTAQTLSRPGWAGSGMTATSWWKNSLLYQADKVSTLKFVASQLDDLRALGVDGLLLSGLSAPTSASDDGPSHFLNPALGTLDDFDDLLRQASSHDIRLLVVLPPDLSAADLDTTARFWLTRGVAGFRLPQGRQPSADQAASLQRLRALTNGYVGERIVLGDLDPAAPHAPHAPHAKSSATAQLAVLPLVFSPNATAPLRLALEESSAAQRGVLLDAVTVPPELSRIAATVVLGGPDAAMLHSDEAPGQGSKSSESDLISSWYRNLSVLHHSSPALRRGTTLVLNHDDQNVLAWVVKPPNGSAGSLPTVFVCNLSDRPVQLSLGPDMQRLHLRGSFLRTLLRSDEGMGPMNLGSVTLQPYGVYVGELRF